MTTSSSRKKERTKNVYCECESICVLDCEKKHLGKKIVYRKKGKHSSSIQIVVITQQYTTSDIRQILFVFKDLLPLLQETPVANTKSVLCHGQKLTTLPLIKDISNIFEMNTSHYIYICKKHWWVVVHSIMI